MRNKSYMKLLVAVLAVILSSINLNGQVLRPDSTKKKPVILTLEGADQAAFAAIPDSKGYLNDFENIFNRQQRDSLIILFNRYKINADSNQFTIVTINDYEPYKDISEVATAFADTWQLGYKNKNGVMIIFSKAKKQARIQIGEGLQDKLNDASNKYILDNYIIPQFRAGNYCAGTYNAMNVIFQILYGKK